MSYEVSKFTIGLIPLLARDEMQYKTLVGEIDSTSAKMEIKMKDGNIIEKELAFKNVDVLGEQPFG